ncbi:hypothetical protein TNCT_177601 [Trichonephila clavata]|uniref:Uncharacterized protein n=1 Tax=Trichonephila clavata TaxID=2740835 RepID=A0A8X6HBB7_TRICU|nr:hypothetical protein TNCT_177601 [Trichonephila clavata]
MSGPMLVPLTIPIAEEEMEGASDEDACQHMSFLGAHARSKENKLRYFKAETELALKIPSLPKEEMERLRMETSVAEKELQTILGELALLTCPIVNCPSHHVIDQNAKAKVKKNSKLNDKATKAFEEMSKTNNDNEKLNIFLLAIAKCTLKTKR